MLEVFVREFETYGKNMTLQEVHDCLDEIERIPGFPLITGGIDLAKSHMRSGLERLAYALTIITVATFTGWIVAQFLGFRPGDLVKVEMDPLVRCLLRLAASFVGVFGFSQMYNSSPKMAATAGCVGAVANTLRLELVDLAGLAPAVAVFIVLALPLGLIIARTITDRRFRICS